MREWACRWTSYARVGMRVGIGTDTQMSMWAHMLMVMKMRMYHIDGRAGAACIWVESGRGGWLARHSTIEKMGLPPRLGIQAWAQCSVPWRSDW